MTTADMQPDKLEDAPRGEQFYQGLLDDEIRPVPVSLRATSRGFTGSGGIERSRSFAPEFHRRAMTGVWRPVWKMASRAGQTPHRSAQRRVRKEWGSTFLSGGWRDQSKKQR